MNVQPMNKYDLDRAKHNIQVAKNGVFDLSAMVSAITTQIRKHVTDKINSIPGDYRTQKLTLGVQHINPTIWLNTMKKSKRQKQKILKRLKKYDEIVQTKRSEFMDVYSKATNNLMECKILYDKVTIAPPTAINEILKFQQETKRFISKIIKINLFINKLNYKLEQFAAFGELLQRGIFLFPGENYPAFEIQNELESLSVKPDEEESRTLDEITRDLLTQIPQPSSRIEPITLDRFGATFQQDFLRDIDPGVLDRDQYTQLAYGMDYNTYAAQFPQFPNNQNNHPPPPPGGGGIGTFALNIVGGPNFNNDDDNEIKQERQERLEQEYQDRLDQEDQDREYDREIRMRGARNESTMTDSDSDRGGDSDRGDGVGDQTFTNGTLTNIGNVIIGKKKVKKSKKTKRNNDEDAL